MSRKTKIVTISDEGRDNNKRFLITEMPAYRAEKWAQRALLALAHSEVDLGEAVMSAGMAGLALAGLKALEKLSFAEAEPLLDEMLDCVRIIPDPRNIHISRPLMLNTPGDEDVPEGSGDDVQEVVTLIRLREAVFELHTGFFGKGMLSRSTSKTTMPTVSPDLQTGKTSHAPSPASSRKEKRR